MKDARASDRAERSILVVEDHHDVRMLYVECLRLAGFVVEGAADGAEAVAVATVHPPDAVVMDLQMPILDGWEAMRRIRTNSGQTTYMLALSAYASDEARVEAYLAGADDVIMKPIDPPTLVSIVRAALLARSDSGAGR